MNPHEVYLILEQEFHGDLWSLSRAAHVWIIQSPQNQPAILAVRARESDGYTPYHGVSSFRPSPDVLTTFYNVLDTIDQHHNEYSALRPWDAIHVVGIELNEVSMDRITSELGHRQLVIKEEQAGFVIRSIPDDDTSQRL